MQATDFLDCFALAHAILAAGRTKYHMARDRNGQPIAFDDPLARQFCLLGAVYRAAHELDRPVGQVFRLEQHMNRVYDAMFTGSLPGWNDKVATDPEALAFLEECAAGINPK